MKTPEEVTDILVEIFSTKSNSNNKDRFQIFRKNFADIVETDVLSDCIMNAIQDAAIKKGLVVTDLGELIVKKKNITDIGNRI